MSFYLIVAKGKHQGMPIPIGVDLFLIGSGEECQLRAHHPSLGEEHCALLSRGRKVFVVDFGNGVPTEVNEEPIEAGMEWPLHLGDRLQIGPLHFMIQMREKHASQKDMEEWAVRCLEENPERRRSMLEDLEELTAVKHVGPSASDIANAMLERLNAQRGMVRGRLRIATIEGRVIVRINDLYLVEEGELALLRKELRENLDRPNLRVLIDFKNVRRLSTSAAAMFAQIVDWMEGKGGKLAMCRLRPELEAMMKSYPGLESVKFYRDKNLALASRW